MNWHDSQAARVTKLKGTKRWKLSQSGRLGGGYLSKILKLSINRERRTSLIKIIHALLHGRRDATAVCDAASFIYAIALSLCLGLPPPLCFVHN